ncbi:MAG: DUF4359 domain-containing protein [Calothrix sp. SM1_7_51]|nr:DUF4359 domain-containing protein [Calothrix sp. SM1_7_51]
MKLLTIIACLGSAGFTVLGVQMARTNPSQAEYEEYATHTLSQYLKSNVCTKTANMLNSLINFNCSKVVDSAKPQMEGIISHTTQRHDFIVFSVYRTNLQVNSWLPSYQFETIGAFDEFYTYRYHQE